MYIERISDKYFREISNFECDEESMEDFLKSEAYNYDLNGEGNTYILLDNEHKILGYYTLKCNAIQVINEDSKYNKYKVFPSVEIARLAINKNYRHNGIGSIILSYIINEILKLRKNIGIKYVFLFSIPSAEKFYTKKNRARIEFKRFPKKVSYLTDSCGDGCKPLYINLQEFEKISDE